jgi:hypothetical protein
MEDFMEDFVEELIEDLMTEDQQPLEIGNM